MTVYAYPVGAIQDTVLMDSSSLLDASQYQSGTKAIITDVNGRNIDVVASGSYWKPLNGVAVIGGSNSAASVTGTTNKTALGTMTIPAGLLDVPGSSILVETLWSVTNNANSKDIRIELGSTVFYNIAATSVLSDANYTMIRIRSTSSQVAMPIASASGLSTSSSAITTGTENMASALPITISSKLTSGADTATLEGWTVRWIAS